MTGERRGGGDVNDAINSLLSPLHSPETLIAEGSFDHTVRLWNIDRGTRVWRKLESIVEEENRRRREVRVVRAPVSAAHVRACSMYTYM